MIDNMPIPAPFYKQIQDQHKPAMYDLSQQTNFDTIMLNQILKRNNKNVGIATTRRASQDSRAAPFRTAVPSSSVRPPSVTIENQRDCIVEALYAY